MYYNVPDISDASIPTDIKVRITVSGQEGILITGRL